MGIVSSSISDDDKQTRPSTAALRYNKQKQISPRGPRNCVTAQKDPTEHPMYINLQQSNKQLLASVVQLTEEVRTVKLHFQAEKAAREAREAERDLFFRSKQTDTIDIEKQIPTEEMPCKLCGWTGQ